MGGTLGNGKKPATTSALRSVLITLTRDMSTQRSYLRSNAMKRKARDGSALAWMLALLAALGIGGAVAWWRLSSTGGVVSYVKVPRTINSFVTDPERISDEQYRQLRTNHQALIVSPLVLNAALQNQDIANLDIVQRHRGTELEWLHDALQAIFPGDGEVMEVRMCCSEDDCDQVTMIVDSVVRAYFDKVLLQERLHEASLINDFRTCLSSLEEGLEADLVILAERRESGRTPDEKAGMAILEMVCDAKQQLFTELKRKELQLAFAQESVERRERVGDTNSGRVVIIQKAGWVDK